MNRFKILFAALGLMVLAGCSSNPIRESWSEPSLSKPVTFDKTLVVAVLDTPANRRVAEQELVAQMPVIRGETSFGLVGDGQLTQLADSRQDMVDAGYDKGLLVRLVSQTTEIVERPSVGVGFGAGSWGGTYSSVGIRTNTLEARDVLTFEISLYELETDTLIWTGTAELSNPGRISSTVERLTDGLTKRWQEEGLIPLS